MAYTIGDKINTTIRFSLKSTGAAVNPTAWQLEVKPPHAAAFVLVYGVDPELTQNLDGATPIVGSYNYEQDTDRGNDDHAGRWQYWVTSTGTGKGSRPGHFVVDPAPIE